MITVAQIKAQLKELIEDDQSALAGEEQFTDGSELIFEGRLELAEGLLMWIERQEALIE